MTAQEASGSNIQWLRGKESERHKRLVQLEAILLGLSVHGPAVIHEPENAKVIAWMRKHWREGYRQVMATERAVYWGLQAAATPKRHSKDCACWDCVLGLNGEVARHQAEMLVRGVSRRRPLVPR